MGPYIDIGSIHIFWLDVVLFCIILLYAVEGYREGFVSSAINLFTFIVSFFVAIQFYSFFGSFLSKQFAIASGFANVIGFFLTAFIVEIFLSFFFSVLVTKIERKLRLVHTDKKIHKHALLNHLLGIVPAILSVFILLAFLFSIILALPFAPFLKQAVSSSQIANFLVSKTQGFEKTSRNVFGEAVNDTLTFLTIEPKSNESVQLHFKTSDVSVDRRAELKMLELVNKERVKAGQKPLVEDMRLTELARAYSRDMFARGYFSHYTPEGLSPFDRMEKAGITYIAAGENLALAPNVDLAMQGLMESPGHRANILSENFGKIGIGVMNGGIYGEMFTQEFTD